MDIKLIAMDLDGTLLDSNKDLPGENRAALENAAGRGIYVVPCTGRYFDAIPQPVRDLPFLQYAITINGASVYDIKEKKTICDISIPFERGLEILDWCSTLGVAYDCYLNNSGFMYKGYMDNIEDYLESEVYCRTVRSMRKPVEDLRAFVVEQGVNIQKIQMFTRDRSILHRAYDHLKNECPDLIATSSLKNNLEINAAAANKGAALLMLAERLGIDRKQTMAIGDGGNDLSMIKAAGVGTAMANAIKDVKEAADLISLSCDGCGVAYAINKLVLS